MIADRVKQLAPDAAMDSWDLLFKPENARRIAPCGITMMDSAIDVVPGVLKYLGKNPDSTDAADLAAVEHTLMGIRRYIRSFASGGALEALASGQSCLALDYSGDVIQAGARAAEARRGVTVRYVAPKEGAQLGFDMLAIPADAEHKDAALMFIDFVLRPDVMAGITNTVRYANAVPASRPMIRPELLADTNVFPTPGADRDLLHHRPGAAGRSARAHPDVGAVQGRALAACSARDGTQRDAPPRPGRGIGDRVGVAARAADPADAIVVKIALSYPADSVPPYAPCCSATASTSVSMRSR